MLTTRNLKVIVGAAAILAVVSLALYVTSVPNLLLLIFAAALIGFSAGAAFAIPHAPARSLLVEARGLTEPEQFEEALAVLNRAVAMSPRLVGAYIMRSAAHAGLSQLDLAVEDAERAVKIAPHQPESRLARSRLYSYRGLHDDAIRDLKAGIREKPDWAVGYMELAQLLVRLEDY